MRFTGNPYPYQPVMRSFKKPSISEVSSRTDSFVRQLHLTKTYSKVVALAKYVFSKMSARM